MCVRVLSSSVPQSLVGSSHLFECWVGWFSAESAVSKVRLLILQELLVIEQEIPFTVQHVLDAGLCDDGVVTLEPLVLVLADEAGVVTTLQGALVVHNRKQRILIVVV